MAKSTFRPHTVILDKEKTLRGFRGDSYRQDRDHQIFCAVSKLVNPNTIGQIREFSKTYHVFVDSE